MLKSSATHYSVTSLPYNLCPVIDHCELSPPVQEIEQQSVKQKDIKANAPERLSLQSACGEKTSYKNRGPEKTRDGIWLHRFSIDL